MKDIVGWAADFFSFLPDPLYIYTACSFRWFIVLKALFAGLLWEKNTAGWLLILLISPNEQGDSFDVTGPLENYIGGGSLSKEQHNILEISPNFEHLCLETRAETLGQM
jgi:hypothetical protein